jgi:hypothetical protein
MPDESGDTLRHERELAIAVLVTVAQEYLHESPRRRAKTRKAIRHGDVGFWLQLAGIDPSWYYQQLRKALRWCRQETERNALRDPDGRFIPRKRESKP